MNEKKWYRNLKKSKLNPPSKVFSPVWNILYITLFVSFFSIKSKCLKWCEPLNYFLIQLFFNLIWTYLFFVLKRVDLSLLDIFLMIIFTFLTIIKSYNYTKFGSLILIPYLIWICFAFYLNLFIYKNN